MPIYEYSCLDCESTFEEIRKMSDESLPECHECKSGNVKKKVSMTAFQLKGGGWYKDGYASAPTKTTAKSEGSEKAPKEKSSKPESKTSSETKTTPKKANSTNP